MDQPCPFCKGAGLGADHLLCLSCNGTGDYDAMMMLRAYRLGRAHERASIARSIAAHAPSGDLSLGAIKAAVVSDDARQRQEDAIT